MRSRLAPRSRHGASTYLELFLLIGVATGGSALVYTTAGTYAAGAQGPVVSVSAATIRQGSGIAVERLAVSNTGVGPFLTVTISTPLLPSSAMYCYSVSRSTGPVSSTCPVLSTNPSSVTVAANLPPGDTVTIQLTILGGSVFAVGSTYTVVVTTSNAAQASLQVVALPA